MCNQNVNQSTNKKNESAFFAQILDGQDKESQKLFSKKSFFFSIFLRQNFIKFLLALKQALTLEKERDVHTLLIPIFLGIGILLYINAPYEPDWLILLSVFIPLALFSFFLRNNPICFSLFKLLLCVFLGVLCAKFEVFSSGTRILGSSVSTKITGHVIQIEKLPGRKTRLLVDIIKTENPKLYYPPNRIRVTTFFLDPSFVMNSLIRGRVRLQPPSGPLLPGGHDFSFESFFNGIGANGFFLGPPERIEHTENLSLQKIILAKINFIRHTIAEAIRQKISGVEGEIATALIVGLRAGILESVNESLRRTGLAHILSISGMHLALVSVTVMFLIRYLLSFFLNFSSCWPIKKYAAAFALIIVTCYLCLSGFDIAACRSFIMVAIMLIAILCDRMALTLRNLSLAATLILIMSPHQILGVGFQMSFAATLCLIGSYQIAKDIRKNFLKSKNYKPLSFWRRSVLKVISVIGAIVFTSLVAGFGSGVYAAWKFQNISLIGVFANLIATPLVSFIIMPFGLMGMIAMPLGCDGFFLRIMGVGLTGMLYVSDWLSTYESSDRIVYISTASVITLTVALLFCMIASTWLRLISLFFGVLGFFLADFGRKPDILISENARLIALHGKENNILVNQLKSGSFILKNWQRALGGGKILKPILCFQKKISSLSQKNENEKKICKNWNTEKTADEALKMSFSERESNNSEWNRFICHKSFCIAQHSQGHRIALAETQEAARSLCSFVSLIVIRDPTAQDPCEGKAHVVLGRILALLGSAAVGFENSGSTLKIHIHHAVSKPFRPWHEHRQFSREARGLPARTKQKKP